MLHCKFGNNPSCFRPYLNFFLKKKLNHMFVLLSYCTYIFRTILTYFIIRKSLFTNSQPNVYSFITFIKLSHFYLLSWGGWIVDSPKIYEKTLTPGTCKCDFIWKQSLCRRDEVKDFEMSSTLTLALWIQRVIVF